jgi:predicted ribosome quality control (RQC) complex YloA/Tae2 family protein
MRGLGMEYSKIKMQEPTGGYNWLEHTIQFIKDIAPFGTAFGIAWKFIHELFKYYSDRRMSELKKIVQDEMKPQIENLTEKIDKLGDAINTIKYKL